MFDDPEKVTYFAKTNSRGKEVPFGIKRKDRARHMYVIGKTGVGKSTLLENLAIQDIRNGEGLAFIDPHGGTADKLLEYVPKERINDVVYFAPFDMDFPIAFNVMEDVGYDKRHLVVSGLMSAFQKIWVDAWSARMEYILSNALLALLEYPDSTLLDVNTMLINKTFRQKVVDNIKDPIVKKFWAEEFAGYSDRYTQDATPAIQNKIGQFSNNPLIRNIIGQPHSSFDIRKAMDEKKILIFNLSKGRVGDVNTRLLGSILVTKIYLSAMSRADVPAAQLTDLPNFYFYVDEFQNFANKSFADILSEARKYKLNLIIAHQYVEQMEEEVRNAVFGNVGTTIAFRVGPFDAEVLETMFQPSFMAADLVNLGMGQIYLTLMIDGMGSSPFSATTLPPFDPPPELFMQEVIAASRSQFAQPREKVETAIADWQNATVPPPPEPKPRLEGRPPFSAARVSSAPRPYAPRPQSEAPVTRPTPQAVPVRTVPEKPAVSAPQPEIVVAPPPAAIVSSEPVADIPVAATPAPQPEPRAPVEDRRPVLRPRSDVPRSPRPFDRAGRPGGARVSDRRPDQSSEAKPERPPLEGNTSLRDALAQAMVQSASQAPQAAAPVSEVPVVHSAQMLPVAASRSPQVVPAAVAPKREDLTSVLRKIAQSGDEDRPMAPQKERPQTPPVPQPQQSVVQPQPTAPPATAPAEQVSAKQEKQAKQEESPAITEEQLRAMLHVDPMRE